MKCWPFLLVLFSVGCGGGSMVFANLAQSASTTFFASPSSVAVCLAAQGQTPQEAVSTQGSTCGLNSVPLDGTLGTDSVNISLMNVSSVNGGTEAVNANGTFTASDLVSGMQGTWSASGGDVPDSGNWTGQPKYRAWTQKTCFYFVPGEVPRISGAP
jgi:hypothetical protein